MSETRPDDWFNQVCAALGLFDGARPVSPQQVLWDEVLPAIEALKTNNPEAAVLIRETQRVDRPWREALKKFADANAARNRSSRATIVGSIGYCLGCAKQLTRCGIPFSGEFACRSCGVVNVYENSQQPSRIRGWENQ